MSSEYTAKLDAFFKHFEIPELHNIELLSKKGPDWETEQDPPTIGLRKSKKLYYYSMHDQTEYIIIITMPDIGITKYNLTTNKCTQLTTFPDQFECKGAETVINPSNGDLYILGGKKNVLVFITLKQINGQ